MRVPQVLTSCIDMCLSKKEECMCWHFWFDSCKFSTTNTTTVFALKHCLKGGMTFQFLFVCGWRFVFDLSLIFGLLETS